MAEQWILDLTKELQHPHTPPDQELYAKSIYRVPKILTDVNGQAYEPKLASFGPYHHDNRHFHPMEQHKQRAMRKVEPRLLASYDSLHIKDDGEDCFERGCSRRHDWLNEKDEFIKLMIVDGCFALEVMLIEKKFLSGEQSEYGSHDPVFGAERMLYVVSDLKRDMLLLENQIPFLALTILANIEGSEVGDVSTLIKSFYNLSLASPDDQMTNKGLKVPTERSFHILDLFKKISTVEGEYRPSYEENVKSAIELKNARVSFCKSKSKSYRDISFNGGVLSLPSLDIDDTTESLLINLMAFERLHVNAGNEVTAYAFFMDGLIKTSDDVTLLRTEDIIMGWVGYDRNIANMFKKITK